MFNKTFYLKLRFLIILATLIGMQSTANIALPSSKRLEKAIENIEPKLQAQVTQKGFDYGSPVFMRIFKDPGTLEVWLEREHQHYELFKTYDICMYSGGLGPKQEEGDRKSPEGFYYVTPSQMNPNSKFHLSFNLGYPNAYDRYYDRTGSALMVHGDCLSIGCYAMTNDQIEEIYVLAHRALERGQPFFRVHIFPFKLGRLQLSLARFNEWYDFWRNLKDGYDYFELHRTPPNVEIKNGKYIFLDENPKDLQSSPGPQISSSDFFNSEKSKHYHLELCS